MYGFTRNFAANTMATASTTANVKKMKRQLSAPKMMPDRVGPIAGANMMISAVSPMALPMPAGGNTSSTTANIMGRIRPVPMPWIKRPASITANDGAKPLTSEPTKNAPRANKVSLRTLNHFISRLASGKTTPMTSIYPMTTHCMTATSTPNASVSCGRAMFRLVSLNMPVKPPRYRPIMVK